MLLIVFSDGNGSKPAASIRSGNQGRVGLPSKAVGQQIGHGPRHALLAFLSARGCWVWVLGFAWVAVIGWRHNSMIGGSGGVCCSDVPQEVAPAGTRTPLTSTSYTTHRALNQNHRGGMWVDTHVAGSSGSASPRRHERKAHARVTKTADRKLYTRGATKRHQLDSPRTEINTRRLSESTEYSLVHHMRLKQEMLDLFNPESVLSLGNIAIPE